MGGTLYAKKIYNKSNLIVKCLSHDFKRLPEGCKVVAILLPKSFHMLKPLYSQVVAERCHMFTQMVSKWFPYYCQIVARLANCKPVVIWFPSGAWSVGTVFAQSTYIPEYYSVCPLVRIGTPHPLSPYQCAPLPREPKRGGGKHTCLRVREWGGGGGAIQRFFTVRTMTIVQVSVKGV
jgi:hypothetical protein